LQYKKSTELAPDFPLPLLGLGQMYLYRERASGRFDAALNLFNKLLDKYPNNVDALRLKAVVLARKDTDQVAQKEALNLFTKLTEIDPRDYDAHMRQAEILMVPSLLCVLKLGG
jgi:tetratricopeptide (TPR) repeat protein